ncbi:MAG: YchF family ATPase [Desulfobacteraceae bacterium]|nr:YchF family ATPase [Desulfobacteraceae bacterium]
MKLGIIGLSSSGKTTVFEALTGEFASPGAKSETRIGTIDVPDPRIDVLSEIYQPQKTIYAKVEYLLAGKGEQKKPGSEDDALMRAVRDTDALIHVVRNFSGYGMDSPDAENDFLLLDQELMHMDLNVVEKRLERMESESKKGKTVDHDEQARLAQCREVLKKETPLRRFSELAESKFWRGYGLMSAKPVLVLFNNPDENESLPPLSENVSKETCMIIRGKLEHELAQMAEDDAAELLEEFNIAASATDRVIRASYESLGLISFFTVGEDEVRAWTIKSGTTAVEAAGAIHSDIQKGFIRAEVISYEDYVAAGSMAAAKKNATLRLEGKTYEVQDGDIITFRFNV